MIGKLKHFKLSVTFLLLLLISGQSKSFSAEPGSIQGFVTDTTSGPLISANVTIRELNIGSQSDTHGFYSIKNIKPGSYIFEVSFLGYQKFSKSIHVQEGNILHLNISLIPTAVQIGGIEVVGNFDILPKDVNTKTVITSGEIEHFQASSIKDILDLVPGVQKSDNPGLSKTTQTSIRGNQNDQLSNFGSLIIMDGVPVSNNANLQFTKATDAALGISNMSGGVDLRTIPADNIESIEVITGLPSVRYGDFTEGIINVQTKMGRTPHRLKIKNNPQVTEGNFGGGILVGETGLNYNLNAARDERNIKLDGDEYYRFTGQAVVSNNFFNNQLNNNIKFNFQTVLDDENPKGDMFQTRNYNHGFTLGLSTWGKYKPSESVSNLDYNIYITMNRQNSMRSKLVQSPIRIVNGDTTSYYIGKVETRGLEWNLGGRLEWNRIFYTGDFIHKVLAGTEPEFNANTGEGVVIDSNYNYYSFDSKKRSYKFSSVPGQFLMSVYAEDKMTGHLLFDFNLTFGFRYEMYRPYKFNLSGLWGKGDLIESHQGSFFNPRIGLMLYLSKNNQIRINFGTTSKSPSMANLFPPELVFTWRNPLDSVMNYYRYNTRVPDLKGYKETQYEVSFDQKISDLIGISVSGYYRRRNDEPESKVIPLFFSTIYKGKAYTYYIDQYDLDINLGMTESKGLEFTLRTSKIKPLNMEFQVTGSYSRIKSYSNASYYDPNPDNSTGQFANYKVPGAVNDTAIGYYYTTGGNWNDRLQLNWYIKYIHPRLGLWVTLRVEQVAMERNQTNAFEPEDLGLLNTTQAAYYWFNRDIKTKPNKFLFNFNISKSLFQGAEISFYVNNFLDDNAVYRYLSSLPNIYSESSRNPSLFYGLEYSMTFDNIFRKGSL